VPPRVKGVFLGSLWLMFPPCFVTFRDHFLFSPAPLDLDIFAPLHGRLLVDFFFVILFPLVKTLPLSQRAFFPLLSFSAALFPAIS